MILMWSSGAFGYLLDYVLWWILFLSLVVHTWCFFRFFPKDKKPRSGLMVGNALVFLSLLGAMALIGESYYRFMAVSTDSFGMSLPARRWFALHTRLNALGFRDAEWTIEKPAGVRRIAFVGDSFAYGWGVQNPEDRFTDRIQSKFNMIDGSKSRVQVMNAAKPGWGTPEQIEPIERLIRDFGVDEVVLCYVPNDIERLLPRSEEFNPIKPPEPAFFDLDRSPLLDQLYRRIVVPRRPTVRHYHDWLAEGFADEEIWREHQRLLGTIIQNCQDHGATLRVVLLPFIRTSGEKFNTRALHSNLAKFFQANHVPVIDLAPILADHSPDGLIVNRLDAHPNALAHQLFAEAIWQAFYADQLP